MDINAAYETLSDPERRARHDRELGHALPARPVGGAVWQGQRLRERFRREQMQRWRAVSMVSLVAMALGLLAMALLARTPARWLRAALLVGGGGGMLILSLVMANR